MPKTPNVFILSADSLSNAEFADHAAAIADSVDGTQFTTAIATASDTNSAMPGLAAGVYSDSIPGWGLPTEDGPTTLAEVLESNGYRCAMWTDNFLFGEQYNYDVGFTGGDLGKATKKKYIAQAVKNSSFAPAFGMLEWIYFNIYSPLKDMAAGDQFFYQPAQKLHQNCLRWLDRNDRPVFCWLHYMDTHHPYEPPAEYLTGQAAEYNRSEMGELSRKTIKSNGKSTSDLEVAAVKKAYQGSCEYLADEVLEFLSELRQKGHFVPSRDILVFTADHGECLDPTRGTLGHVPPTFWDDIINVPLVVATPTWDAETVSDQVSLIRLFPTLLAHLDVQIPATVEGVEGDLPSDMATEKALFVTEWEEGEGALSGTYRGIRTETGQKLFGAYIGGNDVYVATEINDSQETVVHMETHLPSGEPWDDLRDQLAERGEAIELSDGVGSSREIEAHLKDLGYVD
ncbi:sulfatase-like hydrolase/transferase [Halobacteriales archaeon Cl-PHB]